MALDLIGQARALLTRAGQTEGRAFDEDQLAFLREERQYFNLTLVEQPMRRSRAHAPGGDFVQMRFPDVDGRSIDQHDVADGQGGQHGRDPSRVTGPETQGSG